MRALAFVAPGCSALRHPAPQSNTINNKNKKPFLIRQGLPYGSLAISQAGWCFVSDHFPSYLGHPLCQWAAFHSPLKTLHFWEVNHNATVTSDFGNNSFTISSHISLVKFVILKISYLFYLFSFNFLSVSSHTH